MPVIRSSGPEISDADRAAIQRRTVRVLMLGQIVGGVGIGSALAVGALLAEDVSGSESWAGLATTAITLGAALLALPLARAAIARGRRVALTAGWLIATVGALGAIGAAVLDSFPLLLLALILFGSGSAANLQSRYAAADLAEDANRAKALSVVVWSTTIGSVLGPNLNDPGAAVGRALGIPELSGPFVFSAVAFTGGALVMWVLLRPDPLLTARAALGVVPDGRKQGALGPALTAVRASRRAMFALFAVVVGHAVMVSVMAMTPVHMKHGGADLSLVGLTISLHIAGMYALSPVVGWAADRFGRIPVIATGHVLLLCAAVTAGTAGHRTPQVMAGLILLGLGWSCSMVGGSTLLAESVSPAARPGVQGASDLLMNLAGALGGAASGGLLDLAGYGGLNTVAGLLVAPVLCLVSGYALGRSKAARLK